jgi:hypothetical protein
MDFVCLCESLWSPRLCVWFVCLDRSVEAAKPEKDDAEAQSAQRSAEKKKKSGKVAHSRLVRNAG